MVSSDVLVSNGKVMGGNAAARPRISKPLVYSGSLDRFEHQDLTPIIGREYKGLQVTDLLNWGDDMIRDLAITGMCAYVPVRVFPYYPDNITTSNRLLTEVWVGEREKTVSRRGVVFLRDQVVNPYQMRDLMLRITDLAGCVSFFSFFFGALCLVDYF